MISSNAPPGRGFIMMVHQTLRVFQMHRLIICATDDLMADQVRNVSNRKRPPRASPGNSIFICGTKGVLTLLISHNPRSRWYLIVVTFWNSYSFYQLFSLGVGRLLSVWQQFLTMAGTCKLLYQQYLNPMCIALQKEKPKVSIRTFLEICLITLCTCIFYIVVCILLWSP